MLASGKTKGPSGERFFKDLDHFVEKNNVGFGSRVFEEALHSVPVAVAVVELQDCKPLAAQIGGVKDAFLRQGICLCDPKEHVVAHNGYRHSAFSGGMAKDGKVDITQQQSVCKVRFVPSANGMKRTALFQVFKFPKHRLAKVAKGTSHEADTQDVRGVRLLDGERTVQPCESVCNIIAAGEEQLPVIRRANPRGTRFKKGNVEFGRQSFHETCESLSAYSEFACGWRITTEPTNGLEI